MTPPESSGARGAVIRHADGRTESMASLDAAREALRIAYPSGTLQPAPLASVELDGSTVATVVAFVEPPKHARPGVETRAASRQTKRGRQRKGSNRTRDGQSGRRVNPWLQVLTRDTLDAPRLVLFERDGKRFEGWATISVDPVRPLDNQSERERAAFLAADRLGAALRDVERYWDEAALPMSRRLVRVNDAERILGHASTHAMLGHFLDALQVRGRVAVSFGISSVGTPASTPFGEFGRCSPRRQLFECADTIVCSSKARFAILERVLDFFEAVSVATNLEWSQR